MKDIDHNDKPIKNSAVTLSSRAFFASFSSLFCFFLKALINLLYATCPAGTVTADKVSDDSVNKVEHLAEYFSH